MDKDESYSAKDIQILKGLEAVRKRPAMYIGDVGRRGFHHLLFEVVDNSIDEALAGYCRNIVVKLHDDGSASVRDDGRGIPVEKHESGKSALEVVTTVLHAGGKFEKKAYQVSGGLHGVGISVVNALSERMEAEVHRNGKIYFQSYSRGAPSSEVKVVGNTGKQGTTIRFKPDPEIFTEKEFDYKYLKERLMELAFLNAGLSITLSDERNNQEETFHYEGGIKEFVEHLNRARDALQQPVYSKKKADDVEIEYSIQYTDGYSDMIYSFVNNIKTIEGGTHLSGFKSALTRAMNEYLHTSKILKSDKRIKGDDALEGLTAVISLKVPNPQFEGQTKTKLGNSEIKGLVGSTVYETLSRYLEENPKEAKMAATKIIRSMQAREAAQKAKDVIRRKSVFESSVLPGKLADCMSKEKENTELFIVEGDSAGGCFSGDTNVSLADGREVSFKQLVKEHAKGKRNYCYTLDKNNRVKIAEIRNPRCTKKNVEVIKVIFDNGKEIVCTPDHLFRTAAGNYVKACELETSVSLAPLYRKISKREGRITIEGYEMVYDAFEKKWIFTHLLADRFNLEKGTYDKKSGSHKHHRDFNKLNNNPDNIVRMHKDDHLRLHSELAKKTIGREDVKEKCRRIRRTPEYREKVRKTMLTLSEQLRKRAKQQWEDEDYKKYMTDRFLKFYNENAEYREKSRIRLNRAQKEYWSNKENRKKQSERVKSFFAEHPERKHLLSEKSKKQWEDKELRTWRAAKTREQWTPEFRKKRKESYNKTYFENTLSFMKTVYDRDGSLENFDRERVKSGNKNLLRSDTFAERFFDSNFSAMLEAVKNYNHKIISIEKMKERMDVYDLEVEGTHNFALSAGVFVHNSAKQGRDKKFQAILPLRGKILNVEKAPAHRALSNEEIKSLILAMGTGFKEDFDISKLRYNKIIIMTDADVDGAHIRTLLLTLFYRYFKPLVEKGHLYIAHPPLYKVKKGKTMRYAYSDAEKANIYEELGGGDVQRYKGLGEMNPGQLWDTTMDPDSRILKKVTVDDAMLADEMFTILMGGDVAPRREFIEKHALEVKNLDV